MHARPKEIHLVPNSKGRDAAREELLSKKSRITNVINNLLDRLADGHSLVGTSREGLTVTIKHIAHSDGDGQSKRILVTYSQKGTDKTSSYTYDRGLEKFERVIDSEEQILPSSGSSDIPIDPELIAPYLIADVLPDIDFRTNPPISKNRKKGK